MDHLLPCKTILGVHVWGSHKTISAHHSSGCVCIFLCPTACQKARDKVNTDDCLLSKWTYVDRTPTHTSIPCKDDTSSGKPCTAYPDNPPLPNPGLALCPGKCHPRLWAPWLWGELFLTHVHIYRGLAYSSIFGISPPSSVPWTCTHGAPVEPGPREPGPPSHLLHTPTPPLLFYVPLLLTFKNFMWIYIYTHTHTMHRNVYIIFLLFKEE